jgi:hypothetical protein
VILVVQFVYASLELDVLVQPSPRRRQRSQDDLQSQGKSPRAPERHQPVANEAADPAGRLTVSRQTEDQRFAHPSLEQGEFEPLAPPCERGNRRPDKVSLDEVERNAI